MKVNILAISAEPRLVEAIRDDVDASAAGLTTAHDWAEGRRLLLEESFEMVCLDYEALKLEDLETFITIDNILQKEQARGVLLVREHSERTRQLEGQLTSLETCVDMSRGRSAFDAAIRGVFDLCVEGLSDVSVLDDPSLSSDAIITREVDLPAPEQGSLLDLPLSRLLYTIIRRKETGKLTLRTGEVVRAFLFTQGELVDSPEASPVEGLARVFSWATGNYQFEPGGGIDGDTVDPMALIVAGIREQVQQRRVVEALVEEMERYPVRTNLWEERRGKLDFPVLDRFMAACDGERKLEKALSSLGHDAEAGFRAAFFAFQTDLVCPVDAPGLMAAMINYSRSVRQAREAVDEAEVRKTKAYRASSGSGRSQLERELAQALRRMKKQEPHDVFNVWEGCGREVVQERFYQLVKEHHPDVYGGNITGNVKTLAQEIFILIKQTYQKLLRAEKQQTVPPPDAEPAEETASKVQRPSRRARPTPLYRGGDVGAQSSEELETVGEHRRTKTDPKRQAHSTPLAPEGGRGATPSETEERPPSTKPSGDENKKKVDVKSRIASLSGFKRRRRSTPGFNELGGVSSEAETAEISRPTDISPPPESGGAGAPATPEPEDDEATKEFDASERRAKLDALLEKAKNVEGPNAPDPARDAFNTGYRAYRNDELDKAFASCKKAYDMEPSNGLYQTFYGYLLFRMNSDRVEECEEILKRAVDSGHRQAAPDAHLFLGHVLKAQGKTDRAQRHYQLALRLNPKSHEAQREVRLMQMRDKKRKRSDPGTFIKKLFKK